MSDQDINPDVVKPDASTEPEPTPAKPEMSNEEIQALKEENARIKRANATLNTKLKEKVEVTAPEPEPEPNTDRLATREGWMEEIDERSEKKAKALLTPFVEAATARAKSRFLASHPDYGTAEKKAALQSVLEAAQLSGKVEEGELLSEMGKSWAAANWQTLETQAAKLNDARTRSQKAALSAAGTSDSEPATEDFTDEEREEAALYGKDPAAYRKAMKLLKSSTHSTD